MPLKGSCLLKDTPLKEALFDVVELSAYQRLSDNKSASLSSIYNELRKAGVEVDLPTVGEIYNDVLPRDDTNFDSEIEIEDFVGKTFRDATDKLVELETLVGEKQIGDQKPEAAVVEFMLKALYDNIVDDQRTTSDMKRLQSALWDGMKRKLGKLDKAPPTRQTMSQLIEQSLGWEQIGVTDVMGRLNSIEDLYNSMREELGKATDEIRFTADQATADKFNEYVKNLENASYKLLFRTPDAIQVRNDALINAGFGKKTNNGQMVLDWDKLAAYTGSVADLRANAHRSFEQAGFSDPVVERLKDTLHQEFIDLRTEIVSKQLSNPEKFATAGKKIALEDAGLNQLLAGKTIGQWLKDQNIEDVEQLAEKTYKALSGTKYATVVKKLIVDKLQRFFNDNYATVNEAEAKKAIEVILGEKSAVEWIKENGIQNQDDLYAALDKSLSSRTISPQNNIAIKQEFDRILDIDQKAAKELSKREELLNKEYKPKKTDLRRMVELYHLGIFNRAHDQLLYNLVGVNNLQAADIADLEELAKAASDLSRRVADMNGYNLASDQFVSRRFQFIQRKIDSITDRNISNKTNLLNILREIVRYLDLMLTGLLAMPTTIAQNLFSGARAVMTGMRVGFDDQWKSKTKQSIQLYFAMLKEVTATGQSYGEEIGSFATRELFANTLRWKWGEGLLGQGTTIKDKVRSLLFAATLPARIGLLAFDSANKVALTNKVFYNMIYNSLVKRDMSKKDALEFINEMLYGQSFDDAKVLAKKIIDDNNKLLKPEFRSKATNSEIITLANDIVKANLNTSGSIVPTGVLEAALKGSYHVAGLGLGHEPNNPMSVAIKSLRDRLKKDEQRLVREKDWYGLGIHRIKSGLLNNFVIRFAGGATNWLALRAKEGLGLGLVTGGLGLVANREVDFSNAETLQRQMRAREKSRNDIARALVGLSYNALAYAIGFAVVGGGGGDDDEQNLAALKAKKKKSQADREMIEQLEKTGSVYRSIKNDVGKGRWFRVMAPDIMLVQYYMENSKSGTLGEGILTYFSRTYNGDDRFSVSRKIVDATKLVAEGDTDGALGIIASIAGERVAAPFWRPYKEYYRVVHNWFSSHNIPPSRYEPPTTLSEGLFGGGMLQDLGVFKRDTRITMVPGVGIKAYERFKKSGISKMSDLEDGWWDKKDKDGFIMQADERAKAKSFYENYKKQN